MKILKLNPENPDMGLINKAIDVMAEGGVILYPTDTVYGLGANIFNKEAVERINEIKQRDSDKPLSVLVSNLDALDLVADVNFKNWSLINRWLPGPFTFILPKQKIVPSYISPNDKIGVRIPDNKIAISLARVFPIVTTSANVADKETLSNPQDILKQIGDSVDLIIDVGDLESSSPSTIIDLTDFRPALVRRGSEIIKFTKSEEFRELSKDEKKAALKHKFKEVKKIN